VQISGKKLANDKAGHEALDRIFRAVGRELVDAGGDHVAKAGGDLYLRVKDQAELDRVMGVVRAKLPQWVELSAGLGERKASLRETIDGINAVHDPVVEKRRAAGTFAQREGYPAAFSGKKAAKAYAKAISELPDHHAEAPLTAAHRERHAALEPRAAAETAYRTEGGLLTETGWTEARQPGRAKAHVASMDLRKISKLNDALGREATDRFLVDIEQEIARLGGADFDASHRSGDEFAWQSDDLKKLHEFGLRVREAGRRMWHAVQDTETGELIRYTGLEFAIGEGKSWDEADGTKLRADKARLDAELPADWFERRVDRRPAGGDEEASGPVQAGGVGDRGPGDVGGAEGGHAQDFPGLAPDRIEEVRSLLRERAQLTSTVELKQGDRITDVEGEAVTFTRRASAASSASRSSSPKARPSRSTCTSWRPTSRPSPTRPSTGSRWSWASSPPAPTRRKASAPTTRASLRRWVTRTTPSASPRGTRPRRSGPATSGRCTSPRGARRRRSSGPPSPASRGG
jgi:GGDEF domain-containing protein